MTPHPRARLALIGCGEAAALHVPACREAGFTLAAVAGRPGSSRVREFASRFGIPSVVSDPMALAASADWDALVLAVEPEAALGLLQVAADSGRPVLVEKPVALASARLRPFITRWPKVIVGYNRRFYVTARAARDFAAAGAPCLAQLELPEDAPVPDVPGAGADPRKIFTHSVHGFDLARFVLGPLATELVLPRARGTGRDGVSALLRSRRGDIVHYIGNWNAPSNVSLTLDQDGRRYRMSPFEDGAFYEGMTVIEPGAGAPIRRYVPTLTGRVMLDACDQVFKPGLVQQARELLRLCHGRPGDTAATLEDAVAALELAEAVTGTVPTGDV